MFSPLPRARARARLLPRPHGSTLGRAAAVHLLFPRHRVEARRTKRVSGLLPSFSTFYHPNLLPCLCPSSRLSLLARLAAAAAARLDRVHARAFVARIRGVLRSPLPPGGRKRGKVPRARRAARIVARCERISLSLFFSLSVDAASVLLSLARGDNFEKRGDEPHFVPISMLHQRRLP